MKEAIYGWYPSVHDIYRPKGRPTSHHLEGLYNFKNYQGQKVSHQSELSVTGVSSTTPQCTPQDIRRKPISVPIEIMHQQSIIHIPTPIQCWSKNKTPPETRWGLTDDLNPRPLNPLSEVSWPVLQDSSQQQEHQHLQKCLQHEHVKTYDQQHPGKNVDEHNGKGSQTPSQDQSLPISVTGSQTPSQDQSLPISDANLVLTWPAAHKALPLRPQSSYSRQSTQCHEKMATKQRPASTPLSTSNQRNLTSNLTPTPPSGENAHMPNWHLRTQSATVRREKKSQSARPVTAGIMRQTAQEELRNSKWHHSERPAAPVPFAVMEAACDLQDVTKRSITPSPDEDNYETIVDKYGWRAQIPGDPYQLKRPMKRESYTVECSVPDTLPAPPVIHMGTYEPFFLNTIPKKPLSFSVHKEWMSEVLLAKRLELQKRNGGIKYNYRNFAFVY